MNSAWVIESATAPPLFWTGDIWAADADKALRYARRVDAERAISAQGLHDCAAKPWAPPAAPPPPSWREG